MYDEKHLEHIDSLNSLKQAHHVICKLYCKQNIWWMGLSFSHSRNKHSAHVVCFAFRFIFGYTRVSKCPERLLPKYTHAWTWEIMISLRIYKYTAWHKEIAINFSQINDNRALKFIPMIFNEVFIFASNFKAMYLLNHL